MKHALILLVFLGAIPIARSQMLDDAWVFSVAYIANESTGKGGTGFFVGREFETNRTLIFLVSNRHVLAPKEVPHGETNRLAKAKVMITRDDHGQLSTLALDITLRESDGSTHVVTHPNTNIDVAVIDVSRKVIEDGGIRKDYKVGFVPEGRFASKEAIKNTQVTIGQQIIFLGYPLNLVEGSTAIAVARGGVIATPPDRNFRGRPVFLIDCATIRGSSGSPVFLPMRPFKIDRDKDGTKRINHNAGYTPCLLGMVAETVSDWELELKRTEIFGLPPSTIAVMSTANLGIAFRADAISETLDATSTPRFERKGELEF